MEYCFKNQDYVLDANEKSYNQIVIDWTSMVAKEFGLTQKDLTDLYDYDTDKHNSEMRTRYFWKYSTHKGVYGTPTLFANGVLVQVFPGSANDWMQILKDIQKD